MLVRQTELFWEQLNWSNKRRRRRGRRRRRQYSTTQLAVAITFWFTFSGRNFFESESRRHTSAAFLCLFKIQPMSRACKSFTICRSSTTLPFDWQWTWITQSHSKVQHTCRNIVARSTHHCCYGNATMPFLSIVDLYIYRCQKCNKYLKRCQGNNNASYLLLCYTFRCQQYKHT
jgi:hypothetical protein